MLIRLIGALLLGALACAPEVPNDHRKVAETCSADRPAANAGLDASVPDAGCTLDSDCTDGTSGRCEYINGFLGSAPRIVCTYDECLKDSDCEADDGACLCLTDVPYATANTCVGPGNCQVDGDCGKSGYCSLSLTECGENGGYQGYFCHTSKDECVNDSDCGPDAGWESRVCYFDQGAGYWMCTTETCVY